MENISLKLRDMLTTSYEIYSSVINNPEKCFLKDFLAAIEMLENDAIEMFDEEKENRHLTDNVIALALILYNSGIIYKKYMDFYHYTRTEEKYNLRQKAIDFFVACAHLLYVDEVNRKSIFITMIVIDELYEIVVDEETIKQCYPLSLHALHMYTKYTEEKYLCPIDITSEYVCNLEGYPLDTKILLDYLHVQNLRRLSIWYNHFPGNKYLYILYMHNLLNAMLKGEFLQKHYWNWAITAVELYEHLMDNNCFVEAKYHLATALYIIVEYKTDILKTMMTKTTIGDNEDINSTSDLYKKYQFQCAKIVKLWGQYGVQYLYKLKKEFLQNKKNESKKQLLKNEENESCKPDNSLRKFFTKSKEKFTNDLTFTNMDKDLKDYIIKYYYEYPSNFYDVLKVFEKALEYFNIAMEYFTVEKDIRIYGKIILYISRLHKYLADFEQDTNKRIKIYERQITNLKVAITQLGNCRDISDIKNLITLDLAMSYSAILDTMNDYKNITMCDDKYNKNLLLKMKEYMCNSINSFQLYLSMS